MIRSTKVLQTIDAIDINKIVEINSNKIQRFKTFTYAKALYEIIKLYC